MKKGCSSSNAWRCSSFVNVNPETYDRVISYRTSNFTPKPAARLAQAQDSRTDTKRQWGSRSFPGLCSLLTLSSPVLGLQMVTFPSGKASRPLTKYLWNHYSNSEGFPQANTHHHPGGHMKSAGSAVTIRLQISPCTACFCCKNFSISFWWACKASSRRFCRNKEKKIIPFQFFAATQEQSQLKASTGGKAQLDLPKKQQGRGQTF